MLFQRKAIFSIYLTCLLLLSAVLAVNGFENLDQTFLRPLDNSYSVLGKHSVFRDYLGSSRVYVFLPYWSIDDRDLNLDYITDFSYFGVHIDSKARIITNDGSYKKWRESKKLASAIKAIRKSGGNVSLTLICQEDDTLDSILSCEECWEDLAKDVEKELKWAGIKDINVDFEYSGYTSPENAQSYTRMVGMLNERLDKDIGGSFVVVSAYADSADRSEKKDVRLADPKSLAKVSDALFIMAYDFHRPTSSNAGPVSPLDGSYTTTKLNLTKTLESYLKVVPGSKLILGLPFYGYDWVVEDETPMSARIEGSDAIGFSKVKTYAEIINLLVSKNIKPEFHDSSKSYFVNYVDPETGSKRQIWYDNAESLKPKITLASKNNLLGVGVWALGYEGGYADLWKAFKSRP